MAGVVETPLGTTEIPQVSMTSPTAPAATHRWTNVRGFVDEVAEARIWAGFHWRFSTEDGRDTAYKIGHYVATNFMQPITVASR